MSLYVRSHANFDRVARNGAWSLATLAARIGEITVALLNAESRDLVSTIEMKCFDQRGLEVKDI